MSLHTDAAAIGADLVALRRRLHRHPEVGFDLPQTQSEVLAALDGLGLEIESGVGLSSVTAVLRGARPGPAVLLRADMDALGIREETGLEYASENDSMPRVRSRPPCCRARRSGPAAISQARADRRERRVHVPARRGGGRGAPIMIREGVLDAAGVRVEAAYGIHVMPGALGVFSTKGGALMGGANVLRVRVNGRGGHGSRPHEAVDPVPALAEIVLALQTYVTRRVSVFEPAVISVTKLSASEVLNVIPEHAELAATVRTLSPGTTQALARDLPALAERIAEAHGCRAEAVFEVAYPVTVNDETRADAALAVLTEQFGAERALRLETPMMASEDFSFVLDEVPGAYVFLGATPPSIPPSEAEMNHSPRAVFDDSVLPDQAAALVALALSHVGVD